MYQNTKIKSNNSISYFICNFKNYNSKMIMLLKDQHKIEERIGRTRITSKYFKRIAGGMTLQKRALAFLPEDPVGFQTSTWQLTTILTSVSGDRES